MIDLDNDPVILAQERAIEAADYWSDVREECVDILRDIPMSETQHGWWLPSWHGVCLAYHQQGGLGTRDLMRWASYEVRRKLPIEDPVTWKDYRNHRSIQPTLSNAVKIIDFRHGHMLATSVANNEVVYYGGPLGPEMASIEQMTRRAIIDMEGVGWPVGTYRAARLAIEEAASREIVTKLPPQRFDEHGEHVKRKGWHKNKKGGVPTPEAWLAYVTKKGSKG